MAQIMLQLPLFCLDSEMKGHRMRLVLAAAIALLGLPVVSNATPIRIDFNITSVGYLSSSNYAVGVSGSGYFTFDDSLIPAAANTTWYDPTVGLTPIDASFSWFGSVFDESQIRISRLVTDAAGNLKELWIGTSGGCGYTQSSGGLTCISSPNSYDDFYATGFLTANPLASAYLGRANVSGFAGGSGFSSRTVLPVPEPLSIGLVGLGLIALGVSRRARKS